MTKRLVFPLLLLLVAAGALTIRWLWLSDRPMHADEAVQAARFRELWQSGRYVYDPDEFHGPTLSFATLPAVWIGRYPGFADTTEATYRVVPAFFGVGLILLLWLLGDALGKPAAVCAAVLTAISPAMVYYSRYYIHETLFVFFTLAAITCLWRYYRSGRLAWCLAAGACAGLIQATKETSVLVFAAMVLALPLTYLWNRIAPAGDDQRHPQLRWWHLAATLATGVLVAAVLLSSFLTNPRGPLDGVLSYVAWVGRAGGDSIHAHPWDYYLRTAGVWQPGHLDWRTEAFIFLMAAIGFAFALLPARYHLLPDANLPFVRWIGFYALLLTAAYSAIPYKTPWCLLGFLQPLILLAGVGAVALVRLFPTPTWRALTALVLLAATAPTAWQSYRANYVFPFDPGNPYAYAHTQTDIRRLADDVQQLARAAPERQAVLVKVVWDNNYYWPLPWYLRGFERVEFWNHVPYDPPAPIVIAAPQHDAALTEQLDETHLMTGYYGLRPGVLAQLWVRVDLWEAHLRRLGRL